MKYPTHQRAIEAETPYIHSIKTKQTNGTSTPSSVAIQDHYHKQLLAFSSTQTNLQSGHQSLTCNESHQKHHKNYLR
ncbi:hypothetical protein FUT69_01630 [Xylella taiwanensis]|uniref:Uncharacterized protein n=1 Tax=Xylella taiwanensis TaxID=1444770 RepID=A0ABS8TU33_9GAMM|nr:hypothetical protein [Xylella taiwanensis]MCD8457284.1 hypothetical protein [Xylella taiwanensis]MCD8459694.1 hypothetical protein [Xylella taiwanensis]MCD8461437.1 hypothetical protein [Xylella taiwanensis]MCD8462534.1 hypothetical protein [Xylella taiwanensis]MCD8466320.1 hypothetical protein [Xylella taiwanensis]